MTSLQAAVELTTQEFYRLAIANQVLDKFAPRALIERRLGVGGGYYVHWECGQKQFCRRWMVRGCQDFYPVWSRQWIGGGTSCTALSQLIRWLRREPVLPISTWKYWASETVKLLPESAVDLLLRAGYPVQVQCVLCGREIESSIDWWNLNGVSGPCCSWTTGCRQNTEAQGKGSEA